MEVYRIEDGFKRGPWRPGFSRWWTDVIDRDFKGLDPIFNLVDVTKIKLKKGEMLAVACPSKNALRRWISDTEYERLTGFLFRAVALEPRRTFYRDKNQWLVSRDPDAAVSEFRLY